MYKIIIRLKDLIGVSKTTHTTHDTKDIVVSGIDTDLSGVGTRDSSVGKNKLKSGVINTGEIATSRRLVFFGAKSEGVYVNTSIGGTCVVLGKVGLGRSMYPHAQRSGLGH